MLLSRRRRIGAVSMSVVLAAGALAATAPAASGDPRPVVPTPTVQGPIPATSVPGAGLPRDYPFLATPIDLAARGYVEEEYFISGEACQYAGVALTTATGRTCGFPYTTRIIVRRPASPAAFNGAVLAEWQNVTAQYDIDHYWLESSDHIMRAGYAWVGISAQRAGIQPLNPATPGVSVNTLKAWSPTRYGALDVTVNGTVTTDGLRFDIFSQAVQALRTPGAVDPLGPLDPTTVIAVGTSQSGSQLALYHNSIQPFVQPVVDAFFIGESRGAIRTDLPTPVLRLLSEVDVLGSFTPADGPWYRHWEVAGTSHASAGFIFNIQPLIAREQLVSAPPVCTRNPVSRIPKQYVYNAAWDQMVTWVRTGVVPPVAPRITFDGAAIRRAADGNALGGIRLSEHDVPTAYNGTGNSPLGFCVLFGVHEPFTPTQLARLYPNTGRYVSRVARVNEANVRSGYLLQVDSELSTSLAARSRIGR
jgi:hypothetical protein